MAYTVQPDPSSLRVSREAARRRDVAQAQLILRGVSEDALAVYVLAERLKNDNEFGYARRLYGRIRVTGNYAELGNKANPVKVGQRHALCTYKDPDLPAADRFRRALEILDEVEILNLAPREMQESLGLRGAVYKRMWQVEGQSADLARSCGYYLKGYTMGPENDQGYTGINAAFVLEHLAREAAIEARKTGAGWTWWTISCAASKRSDKRSLDYCRVCRQLPDDGLRNGGSTPPAPRRTWAGRVRRGAHRAPGVQRGRRARAPSATAREASAVGVRVHDHPVRCSRAAAGRPRGTVERTPGVEGAVGLPGR